MQDFSGERGLPRAQYFPRLTVDGQEASMIILQYRNAFFWILVSLSKILFQFHLKIEATLRANAYHHRAIFLLPQTSSMTKQLRENKL